MQVVLDPDTKVMTISGEREVDRPVDDDGDFVRVERKVGRFERRFKLPDNIDADNITAKVLLLLSGAGFAYARSASVQRLKRQECADAAAFDHCVIICFTQVTSGVLEVHMPKTAPAKDKQQKINVA